jgi:hypothetical protein
MALVTVDFGLPIEAAAAVYSDSDQTGYLDDGTGTGLASGMGDPLASGYLPWRGFQLEFGTQVQATLLQSTWSGDFSPDFGPSFGGGAPAEWQSGAQYVSGNSNVPVEALATAARDWQPIEWAALFRSDMLPAIDAGLGVRADGWPPAEALVSTRGDPGAPAETQATRAGDAAGRTESGTAARADPPAMAELLSRAAADPPQALEAAAASRVDWSGPAEFLGSHLPLHADTLAPIEALLAAKSDNAPVEWAALFRSDTVLPGEAVTLVRADPAAPAESAAAYRLDIAPVIEALSAAARSDPLLPIEALLSAVRDGAYLELGSTLRLDPPAAAEAGETLRADPGVPAETAAGAARTDAALPLEALLLAARDAHPVEWLAAVRALVVIGNSDATLEWSGIVRADGAPIVEGAALFQADPVALVEWFRTLAADIRLPAEAGATAPAPLLFVSRGRLR